MLKTWFKAAGVRAIKTACQSAVAMIPIGTIVTMTDLVNCGDTIISVILTAVLAGVLSLLTSVEGIPEVEDGESIFKLSDDTEETEIETEEESEATDE